MKVLVRGSGDIASAVAHALFSQGHAVAIHDGREPTASRRLMAYSDALFDGVAELEGVVAVRTDRDGVAAALDRHTFIPITAAPFLEVLAAARWEVLVDARMRKHEVPESQIALAPLTVGLGPNFVAGETVTVAVETSWEALGRVVLSGPTMPLAGEPRAIAGKSRERYVYAPVAGRFHSDRAIRDAVTAGEVIGRVDTVPLAAPIDGAIRALSRSGIMVAARTKIIEIDPRGPAAVVGGIGERPRRIAAGVLQAVARLALVSEA